MPIDYEDSRYDITPTTKQAKVTKASSGRSKKGPSLERRTLEALELMHQLGFKVLIPTNAEDAKKHEESAAKLGFVDAVKPKAKVSKKSSKIIFTLYSQHSVGGRVFGPGAVELDSTETDLHRTLLQQDQICVRSHNDGIRPTGDQFDFTPVGGSYLITKKTSREGTNYRKKLVQDSSLSEMVAFSEAAVTAGAIDAAGYNSNSVNTQGGF